MRYEAQSQKRLWWKTERKSNTRRVGKLRERERGQFRRITTSHQKRNIDDKRQTDEPLSALIFTLFRLRQRRNFAKSDNFGRSALCRPDLQAIEERRVGRHKPKAAHPGLPLYVLSAKKRFEVVRWRFQGTTSLHLVLQCELPALERSKSDRGSQRKRILNCLRCDSHMKKNVKLNKN
ncbi:uncharacterized protein MEPE_01747 [Melanopsichium pennsylvanicum]|uniref:Uncharacterized protein n=1 Tax=Melanopsichium pennsylvanicum TaxID=63383 RepID=A0AAJ5C3W4_9BASI|nr:uncharacterized protein MEPE_01747 [Melanopsichium pennsylvanicum]